MKLTEHVKYWFAMLLISMVLLMAGASIFFNLFPHSHKETGLEKIGETVSEIETTLSGFTNETKKNNYVFLTFSLASIIFYNNAKLNLLFSIPFLGLGFYLYAVVLTGVIGRYISEIIVGDNWFLFMFLKILSAPHTYVELLSYSIVVFESLYLSLKISKRNVEKSDLVIYFFALLLSFGLLYLAAVLEVALII